MAQRVLKILHVLGAIGVAGALASCIVLAWTAPRDSLAGFAAVRGGIAAISQWLLVPSLAIVLISGLLAIAVNRAFHDAGWAWIKALLGLVMFEGTLLAIDGNAQQAAELSALAAAGDADPARLEQLLRTEWAGLWLILALSFANVGLAVWRPRLVRK